MSWTTIDQQRSAKRRKHLLANNLCTQCGKENLAPHSTNKGLNCLKRQAELRKISRDKKGETRPRVEKKEIVKPKNNWSIIQSPLYQCW